MEASRPTLAAQHEISFWERWWQRPETLGLHRVLFQIHMLVGMVGSAYLMCMSLSGSAIVFRNELETSADPNSRLFRAVEWLVAFHGTLLLGDKGRWLNGIGGISLTLLCLTGAIIWWPGIANWRRSLTVNWRSSFARINWDLHNVLGFWCFLFLMMWGISGIYFSFPQPFSSIVYIFNREWPAKLGLGDAVLTWLSNLHFGRFNVFTEALWALLALVLGILAFTGMFMCCHRLLIRKGAPLPK
jgi:uncharacterized iron-regulated membrane protein